MRELTRRDALRTGGAAVVVVGAAAAGCKAGQGEPGKGEVAGGVANRSRAVSAFPLPGTLTASRTTGISFRGAPADAIGTVRVEGSRTGRHAGKLRSHPDGNGAVFVPAKPFDPGEKVTVHTGTDIRGGDSGSFDFRVARPFDAPAELPGSDEKSDAAAQVRAFSSVPDLHPPKLDVVQPAGAGVAPGYIFVAPKQPTADTTQEGPMIVDDRGELVWFHPLESGTEAMDFKVQKYRGEGVLTWWEGEVGPGYGLGEYVIADDRYQEVARVTAGNGYAGDLHEFLLTPQGTALFTIYSAVHWDEPGDRGKSASPVIEGVFQEVDIATGTVLFEWHSLGNITLDESYGDVIADPAEVNDYLHHNSIDVDTDGNFLLSGRHTRTVYKIDRRNGAIIWRLGGKDSDFRMGRGANFAYQHDVQRQPDGTITMFDNAAGSEDSAVRDASRGIVLDVDTGAMTASLVREYEHPDGGILAASQANMQVLPNGNVFIGWGSEPAFTEYTKDGDVLFDARFPSEVESYRAFRYPWKGRPADNPVVGVEAADAETLIVTASWNGATEVATWQVLAGPDSGQLRPVGKQPRDGFETRITVPSGDARVAGRALDGSGKALGTSRTVTTGS